MLTEYDPKPRVQFKSVTNNVNFVQNMASQIAPKKRGGFFTFLGALIWFFIILWVLL